MIYSIVISNDEKNANVGIYVPLGTVGGNSFHLAVANLIQQACVVWCI